MSLHALKYVVKSVGLKIMLYSNRKGSRNNGTRKFLLLSLNELA